LHGLTATHQDQVDADLLAFLKSNLHATVRGVSLKMFSAHSKAGPPAGCVELWAANERTHRHIELAGLHCDVVSLPCGDSKGGDLWAVFSCDGNKSVRVVLADSTGHGFTASAAAEEVHRLLHKFSGTEDAASLLAALNDDLAHHGNSANQAARLTTVVAATMDHLSGEFNFAYAAHPRMLHWRAREASWQPLGQNLDGMVLGYIAGETHNQQSVMLEPADIVLAFTDGVTEVQSPQGEQLSAEGFLGLVRKTLGDSPQSLSLPEIAEQLLEALTSFRGSREFDDDLTLLTLRRPK